MKCAIQHIRRKRNNYIVVESERSVDKPVITIGRGTNQDIILNDLEVALEHAKIVHASKAIYLECIGLADIFLNGNLVQRSRLQFGDVVNAGQHEIVIDKPNDNHHQYTFTIKACTQPAGTLDVSSRKYKTSLKDTWISYKAWPAIIFTAIILVFLTVPSIGLYDEDLQDYLRLSNYPDDGIWETGTMSGPHKYFSQQCERCHSQIFVRVSDQACLACHTQTDNHVNKLHLSDSSAQTLRCGNCHQEHNDTSALVRTHPQFCTNCHANLRENLSSQTTLDNVSSFDHAHPEFKPTTLASGTTEWTRTPIKLDTKHHSGLEFSHKIHLNTRGIDSPDGKIKLQCSDCHRLKSDGKGMLPIHMEQHCQSCHRLNFDPANDARQVKHARPKTVLRELEEYYANLALRGGIHDANVPAHLIPIRRPGAAFSKQEITLTWRWVQDKARDQATALIEKRTCSICHRINKVHSSPIPWNIEKVVLPKRWLPLGEFWHSQHEQLDCNHCHSARQSQHSHDVLLPSITNCRECHSSNETETKLQSTCIDCHIYHQPQIALETALE